MQGFLIAGFCRRIPRALSLQPSCLSGFSPLWRGAMCYRSRREVGSRLCRSQALKARDKELEAQVGLNGRLTAMPRPVPHEFHSRWANVFLATAGAA